jgi:hypothetical protein
MKTFPLRACCYLKDFVRVRVNYGLSSLDVIGITFDRFRY